MSKYKEKMELLQCRDVLKGMYKRPKIEDIRQIEAEIGLTLPPDYVDFLTHYGGFAPGLYAVFSFQRLNAVYDESMADVFYGVLPGNGYDLIGSYREYKGRMPHNLIPIASDPGPGEICLSVDGEDKGAVYYWDRYLEEDVEENVEPGYSNVYLIAKSFDDFIHSLKVDQEV
jgi:cell wall assembly regulator SMI1